MNDQQKSNGLADLVNSLEGARRGIDRSKEILKDKIKSPINYLITKDGTIAETNRTLSKGMSTLKE